MESEILERSLGLSITVKGNRGKNARKIVRVIVREPESGTSVEIEKEFSPSSHRGFDTDLGNEVYSWISLWMDEAEGYED